MNNAIDDRFLRLAARKGKALVIYATAGHPSPRISRDVFIAAGDGGADIIEVGVPFSDPTADGPAIQAASEKALRAGATIDTGLSIAAAVTRATPANVILFGYANPFFARGARFAREAKQSGVSGLLCVDLPPEEDLTLGPALHKHNIHSIRLVAPTSTPARIAQAARSGGGFLYYVSVAGVTGTKTGATSGLRTAMTQIRTHTNLPVVVGFGIRTPAQAAAAARVSDGAVVGSAVVELVDRYAARAPGQVERFVKKLRRAIDAH